MRKLFFFAILTATLLSFTTEHVDDPKARKILNEVSRKAQSYKNMHFDFIYVMIDKKNKINDTLRGTMDMSGNRFNLKFMERTVISDGKTVWTYDPDAEEVQISNTDESDDAFNPGKLLTSFDKKYNSKLIKTINEKGRYFYIIDLYPVKAKAYYKIRVKIDKKELRVVKGAIYKKDNTLYTIIVDKFRADVKLPANHFTFDLKKYPDVEVVDLR